MPTYIVSRPLARVCQFTRTQVLMLGLPLAVLLVAAAPMAGQVAPRSHNATTTLNDGSPSDLIAQGDRESSARRPAAALSLYERAIQLEATNYAALWKASREAVDLGEFEASESVRTGLYTKATDYARRATAANPSDAEGHFNLSRAIGRTALAVGPKDRIKYAVEVRDQAREALRLDPRHPGALHVLGVWNAEVMRLNGFTRTMARAFLGGKVLDSANWADAQRYLEEAVRIEPSRLVHHLDLARIYRDIGRKDAARTEYQAAIRSPDIDANDDRYRQSAEEELRRLRK
ncbi:MAG: hypothetical protein IBJ03_00160 [Gemmatimonadaceae bacterium]|nr:hypothetical protein [Gemmatimonadaceae bacterium]